MKKNTGWIGAMALALALGEVHAQAALIEVNQAQSSGIVVPNTGTNVMTFQRYAGPGTLLRVQGTVSLAVLAQGNLDVILADTPVMATLDLAAVQGDMSTPAPVASFAPIAANTLLGSTTLFAPASNIAFGPFGTEGSVDFDFTDASSLSTFVGNSDWHYQLLAGVRFAIDGPVPLPTLTSSTSAGASMLLRYTVRVPDPADVPAPAPAALIALAWPWLCRRRGRASRG